MGQFCLDGKEIKLNKFDEERHGATAAFAPLQGKDFLEIWEKRNQHFLYYGAKTDRTGQITWTNQIHLMGLIRQQRRKFGIIRSLWFIFAGSAVCQIITRENPIDCAR